MGRQLMSAFGTRGADGAPVGLRSIELGSGRGDLSVLLAECGVDVTLFDVSEAALAQAERRFERLGLSARYEKGDLMGPMADWRATYDIVLSSGVIEHFKGADRSRVLEAHHNVLRPGGLAMVSVPNAWCFPYRVWKSYLELRGWWPYGMEIPYSRRELVRRARDVGFEGVEAEGFGFWDSVGSHWMKGLLGREVGCRDRASRFDSVMGASLLLLGRRRQSES